LGLGTIIYSITKIELVKTAKKQIIHSNTQSLIKVGLYFDSLKKSVHQQSSHFHQDKPFIPPKDIPTEAIFFIKNSKIKTIFKIPQPINDIPFTLIQKAQAKINSFIPIPETPQILISINHQSGLLIWVIRLEHLDKQLSLKEGIGETGETYIIGTDYKFKSSSRFIKDTSVIKVKTKSVIKGLQQLSGIHIIEDYRKIKVISRFRPLHLDDLHYVLISEIDFAEVLAPLEEIKRVTIGSSIFILIITIMIAFFRTRFLLEQFKNLKNNIFHLNKKIINAQEKEREHIAHDIHDGLGQILTALKWKLSLLPDSTKEKNELISFTQDVLNEAKNISTNLMSPDLKDFSLEENLKNLCLKHSHSHSQFKISFYWDDLLRSISFEETFCINLYRIMQELIQNALKHSNAKTLVFYFTINHDFELTYQDDGIGLLISQWPPKSLLFRTQAFEGRLTLLESDLGLKLKLSFPKMKVAHETNHHLSS
jgi:signal transduction histidine kinase